MFGFKDSKEDKKIILDGFSRSILYENLRKSKFKDNKRMYDYIMHEASYKDVVLAAFYNKPFLKEDATSDTKLKTAESVSDIIMQFGPAMMMMKKSEVRLRAIAKMLKIGDVWGVRGATTAAGFILPMLGFMLVNKLLFAFIRKVTSKCRKTCKMKYANDNIERTLKTQLCTATCKAADLTRVIARFRADAVKCRETENPERCQETIVKDIAKMNEMLVKEQQNIANATAKLKQKFAKQQAKTLTNRG